MRALAKRIFNSPIIAACVISIVVENISKVYTQSMIGTQVMAYDSKQMLDIIEKHDNVTEQLALATIAWGKLRADYAHDYAKIDAFGDCLKHLLCQSKRRLSPRQYLQLHLLQEAARIQLALVNTTTLFVDVLAAPDFEKGQRQLEVNKQAQKLLCTFKMPQLKAIIDGVVQKLYTPAHTANLAAYLYQLYSNDAASYELMVHGMLQLYDKYKQRGDKEANFNRYLTQLWQTIQTQSYYAKLEQNTKQRLVSAAIASLEYR